MKEKIKELYKKLRDIVVEYTYYQSVKNCEQILELVPDIQSFIEWFMSGNVFEIDEETYAGMCSNLLDILNDILNSIKVRDHVLLNDTIAYGFMEYLKLFMDEEEYDEDEIWE